MSRIRSIWTVGIAAGLAVGMVTGVVAQSEPDADSTTEPVAEAEASALGSVPLVAPPEIEGLDWGDVSVLVGTEIEATATERSLGEWTALLGGTGATYEQASQLNARAVDPESGDVIGTYSAIRIDGAAEGQLREALFDVLRESDEAGEFLFEEAEIGGKAATVITRNVDEQAVVWVNGDTAHLMDLPDEQLALILASLS